MLKFTLASCVIALSFSARALRADDAVEALTTKLNTFNCLIEKQRDQAYPLALQADDLVEKFAKARKKTPERFQAIVQMVAAALPCNVESGSAFLVDGLRDEPGFSKAFDAALVKVNACKGKNLLATIKEGDDASAGKAPKQIFSYSTCVTGREPQTAK